ncbi:MAG: bifunctional DNA-binding transcriptional regulator/O6-methylguanine-DNA methyltransferase Ada [Haliangiales bacterium]
MRQEAVEERYWQAVLARDVASDGSFVYVVTTTGIYCRPSCPSRRPKRANTGFYADADAAERAGYRACKRCRPDGLHPQLGLVMRVCRLLEGDDPPGLTALAELTGTSPSHLQRVFSKWIGLSPKAYGEWHKQERARRLLLDGETVTSAFYAAGYSSSGRFYERSAHILGMTPTRYRAGGEGTSIWFAVGESALGSVLVAATRDGVCSIALGDSPAPLVQALEEQFPNAQLIGADEQFEQLVAAVVGFVEAPAGDAPHLPLDIRGTAFQCRVWRALAEVPPGTTVSYSQLAEKIGAPSAARAVAHACAANKLAVAIPCHRVVRRDGSLSGYRWGVERKQALLQREGSA